MNKIIQIIPAVNWWAVYFDMDSSNGKPLVEPLAAWALVERDGKNELRGLDAEGYFVDDAGNFVRCVFSHNKNTPEKKMRAETREMYMEHITK